MNNDEIKYEIKNGVLIIDNILMNTVTYIQIQNIGSIQIYNNVEKNDSTINIYPKFGVSQYIYIYGLSCNEQARLLVEEIMFERSKL
jgi:hypothetical protein